MGTIRRLAPVLLLVTALPSGLAADDAKPEKPLTWTGSVGVNAYLLKGAYLGSPDQPGKDADYGWVESVARAGLSWTISDHVSLSAGAAGLFTLSEDPFGLDDDGTAVVESAKLVVTDLFTPGLGVTIGRQEMKIGDGFLVQDGYNDHKADVWSIPLTFWDAARVDYRRGDFAGTAFAAKLSSSYGYDGALYGVDLAWVPKPKAAGADAAAEDEAPKTYVGLSGFARADSGFLDDDARVVSLRGSAPIGPVTLAGEYALQGGRRAGISLGGEAWHADARWDLPFGNAPYLFASYLHYSGDDPATQDDETFLWRNYSSEDWSHYYLGEVAGSSLFQNTDLEVLKLEGGVDLVPSLSLRLFYLDLKADTGAAWGAGPGDALAKEWDAVVTWTPNDATEVWVLFGQARPGSAGEAIYGPDTSNLFSAGFAWSF